MKGILTTQDNYWYGSTTATQGASYWLDPEFKTFRSIEPLLGEFDRFSYGLKYADWVIIGAETGNRKNKVIPRREWVDNIVANCRLTETPVFMKESLRELMGDAFVQEWPQGMPHGGKDPIPHCKDCEHYKSEPYRTNDVIHKCYKRAFVGEIIPGRYARTSPAWCPLRDEQNG